MPRKFASALVVVLVTAGLLVPEADSIPIATAATPAPPVDSVAAVDSVPLGAQLASAADDPQGDPLPDTWDDVPTDLEAEVTPTAQWTQAPGLPVEVRAPDGVQAEEMSVSIDSAAAAPAEESQGAVFVSVATTATGEAPAEGVEIRLDYGAFSELYGGGWADRLHVDAYPACFLTTPDEPDCSLATPVEAVNDMAANSLTVVTTEEIAGPAETTDPVVPPSDEPTDPPTDTPSDTPTDGPSDDSSGGPTESASDSQASPAGDLGGSGRVVVAPALSVHTDLARSVSDTASASAVDPAGAVVLAVASSPGGYGAVPVAPSAEWQVGVGSGEFSYSYGFEVPPSVAGSAPDLGLGYSSAAVDGLSVLTTGQAGPAGLGWSWEPGSITRTYKTCEDDATGSGDPGYQKKDLCWRTDAQGGLVEEMTLSLNGHSARLVETGSGDRWRLKDDPGWRIQRFKDGSTPPAGSQLPDNGDDNNEGFVLTTPDGTEYWFGYGRNATNSVWTVPVFGNDTGEPCHDAGTAEKDRYCQQGWRWNLDRVVDTSGNTIRYTYTTETNRYLRWGGTDASYNTAYDRAGMLSQVEYGFRDSDANATAQLRVVVSRADRCTPQLSDPAADCTGANSARNNPSLWPDVPTDLICFSGEVCAGSAPSFFSIRRYQQVTTQVQVGTAWTPVDEYTLGFDIPPAPGDSPRDLWLDKITRTGRTGGGTLGLAAVTFGHVSLVNKIPGEYTEEYPKLRIDSIRNETGGRVDVVYGHAPNMGCDAAYVAGPRVRWNSDKECFALRWTRPDTGAKVFGWFHKYVVTKVGVGDDALRLGLNTPRTTPMVLGKLQVFEYDYQGAPAWRFAASRNVDTADESWSDWRGYETTVTKTMATTDQGAETGNVLARTKTTRFRGMDQAPANPSQVDDPTLTRPAAYVNTEQFPGTNAAEERDKNWFEGLTTETSTLMPNNDLIERNYTSYGSIQSALTPNDEHQRTARIRYAAWTESHTALNTGGASTGERSHRIEYTVEGQDLPPNTVDPSVDAGSVLLTRDLGDPSIATDNTCAWAKWNINTTVWLRVPVASRFFDGACPDAHTGTGGGTLVARGEQAYDGGTGLTRGLLTDAWTWTTQAGDRSTGADVIHTATDYDTYGRVTKTTGPRDDENMALITTTDYNPGGDNSLPISSTRVTEVNAMTTARTTPASPSIPTRDMVATTELDPGRGLPTRVTDANGGVTLVAYNPLGQPVEVRYPGQDANEPASVTYTYTPDPADPSRVKTSTLRDVDGAGNPIYDDSYVFYDGWGRTIQTQDPQPTNPAKRYVTVTGYDEQTQVRFTIPAFRPAADIGFADIVNPDLTTVPRYTVTDYDAAARPVTVTDKSYTTTAATSSTQYRGDAIVVTPPVGGRTLTQFDRWGRATKVNLYAGQTLGAADIVDAISYSYTAQGELTNVAKTLDGVTYEWDYGYDMTGRQIWAHDPDAGITVTTYDDASNSTQVTTGPVAPLADALDKTDPDHPKVADPSAVITTSYDVLNRPLAKLDETTASSPVTITSYGYDADGVAHSIGRSTSVTHPITGIAPPVLTDAGAYESDVLAYDLNGIVTAASETYPVWLTSEMGDNNPAHPAKTITRVTTSRYTEGGLLEAVDHPAVPGLPATTTNYNYMIGARVRAITLGEAGTSLRISHARYNAIGQTTGLTSGTYDSTGLVVGNLVTGMDRSYGWAEDTGRLAAITDTITPATSSGASGTPFTAYNLAYAYDQVGNPRTITGTAQDPGGPVQTGSWCYQYDGLNRLVRAQTGGANGCANPTEAPAAVTGATYDLTYEHGPDRITAVVDNLHTTGGLNPAPLRVDYETGDANANNEAQRPHHNTNLRHQVSITGLLAWPAEMPAPGTITNDNQGRIKRWEPTLAAGLIDPLLGDTGPAATSYNYVYNHLGQLESSTPGLLPPLISVVTSSSATYSYGPDGTRFARRTQKPGGPAITTLFLGDGTEITKNGNKTTSVRNYTTLAGTPVATQASNTTTAGGGTNHQADWTWLGADAQQSLRVSYLHNPTGTGTLSRHHYYPYGDPTTTGPPETPTGAGYLNQHHDLTGDIRLDQRNYTANLNTLTTPDPLLEPADPQSFNPYAYARNNPITLGDPSGLIPVECRLGCDHSVPSNNPPAPPPAPEENSEPTDAELDLAMHDLYFAAVPDIAEDMWAQDQALESDPERQAHHREMFRATLKMSGPTCGEVFWCAPLANPHVQEAVVEYVAGGIAIKALLEVIVAARAALIADAISVNASTEAAAIAGSGVSRLVPGGGLAAHEAAGGHALARHLGMADADLLARLAANPGISGASSFSSRAVAESSVAGLLDANASGISSWLASTGSKLVLNGGTGGITGRYVAQGSTSIADVTGVRAILVKDANLSVGYRIQTAFPTP